MNKEKALKNQGLEFREDITEERGGLYQLRSLKKCISRHMREANMRRKER